MARRRRATDPFRAPSGRVPGAPRPSGRWRRLAGLAAGALALLGAAPPGPAPVVDAKGWVLADADSGEVLAASNHREALPPASATKLMTALVALEKLAYDATIEVDPVAAAREPMRVGMQAGDRWRFADALSAMLMVSANDSAYAIARAAGGGLDSFADAMQLTAARLGMRDSVFLDPAGFDDASSFRGGSRVSALDLAIAARNVLAVPELAAIVSSREHRFVDALGRPHRLLNHNKMLRNYPGAVGLKTGYTRRAGHTLVAAARRDGRTMIAVVLGSPGTYASASTLLDAGFATPPGTPGIGDRLPPVRIRPVGLAPATPPLLASVEPSPGPSGGEAVIDPPGDVEGPESAVLEGPGRPEPASAGGAISPVLVLVVVLGAAALRRRAVVLRRRAGTPPSPVPSAGPEAWLLEADGSRVSEAGRVGAE